MTSSQERAITHVSAMASRGAIDPKARVTLHFHSDRLAGDRPILDAMCRDGVYRSQFETGRARACLALLAAGVVGDGSGVTR